MAGKDVIFAQTASANQDNTFLPGHDMVPGVFLHVIGAETLKRGDPIDIGWTPALALSLAVLLLPFTTRLQHWFPPIALGVPLALIAATVVLAAMLDRNSVVSGKSVQVRLEYGGRRII